MSARSVFANLTNAYCLVAMGASENFNSIFEAELADHIPVSARQLASERLLQRATLAVGERGTKIF